MALSGSETVQTMWMVRGGGGNGGIHGIDSPHDLKETELITARILAQVDEARERGDAKRYNVLLMELLESYRGDHISEGYLQNQFPEMVIRYVDSISNSPFTLQEIVSLAKLPEKEQGV